MKDADNAQKHTGLYQTQAHIEGANVERQLASYERFIPGQSFRPGDVIDKDYQLTAIMGRGGMGVVYACKHLTLQRDYALKILSSKDLDEEAWTRFKLEAKALARLNHPGIVRIHNMGVHNGVSPYYVMDLLSGETLDVLIQRHGAMKIEDTLRLFIDVADAINSAHLNGVIHRDIKPSNLMILRDVQGQPDTLKIVDFGIARIAQKDYDQQSQTATGLVFGTPYYMSPEQCMGARTDARSDIYSYGCALFETLTGYLPFQGENAFDTFMMHQTAPIPTLGSKAAAGQAFSRDLEDAVSKMLAKSASDRYQSMSQVKHDLERIVQGKPIQIAAKGGFDTTVTQSAKTATNAAHGGFTKQQQIAAGVAGVLLGVVATTAVVYFKPLNPTKTQVIHVKKVKLEVPKDMPTIESSEEARHALLADSAAGGLDRFSRLDAHGKYFKDSAGYQQTRSDAGEIMQSLPMLMKKPAELRALGYSEQQIREVETFDFRRLGECVETFRQRLDNLLKIRTATRARFLTRTGEPFFLFPRDISIGGIRIGNNPPVRAVGKISAPKGVDKVLSLETSSEDFPRLFDQFGPDDLTGLELRWKRPENALAQMVDWRNVKEICFFNPLLKVPPGMEFLDECQVKPKVLAKLADFPKLEVLGLAGHEVTSKDILSLPVLPKLTTLKLKSIVDIDKILAGLKRFDNLHELWLIHENTTAQQLEPLTHMKNLERLTIRLSLLKPSSIAVFKRMKNLRSLTLDRNWTDAEKQTFSKQLPDCKVRFEPVMDLTFWNLLK